MAVQLLGGVTASGDPEYLRVNDRGIVQHEIRCHLRPCMYAGERFLFHKFTDSGKAIIEDVNGAVDVVAAEHITFMDRG